jgi:hypothetical protein
VGDATGMANLFDIQSFVIDLTFELWHLKFQIFEGELHAQKD